MNTFPINLHVISLFDFSSEPVDPPVEAPKKKRRWDTGDVKPIVTPVPPTPLASQVAAGLAASTAAAAAGKQKKKHMQKKGFKTHIILLFYYIYCTNMIQLIFVC
jgi:hypothetical protein